MSARATDCFAPFPWPDCGRVPLLHREENITALVGFQATYQLTSTAGTVIVRGHRHGRCTPPTVAIVPPPPPERSTSVDGDSISPSDAGAVEEKADDQPVFTVSSRASMQLPGALDGQHDATSSGKEDSSASDHDGELKPEPPMRAPPRKHSGVGSGVGARIAGRKLPPLGGAPRSPMKDAEGQDVMAPLRRVVGLGGEGRPHDQPPRAGLSPLWPTSDRGMQSRLVVDMHDPLSTFDTPRGAAAPAKSEATDEQLAQHW